MREPSDLVGGPAGAVTGGLVGGAALFLLGLWVGSTSFSQSWGASHGVNRELVTERLRLDFGVPTTVASHTEEQESRVPMTLGEVGAVRGERPRLAAEARADVTTHARDLVTLELGQPTLPAGRLVRETAYEPWGTVVAGGAAFNPWTEAPPGAAYEALRPFATETPPEPAYDPWGTSVVSVPATLTFPFVEQRTVRGAR